MADIDMARTALQWARQQMPLLADMSTRPSHRDALGGLTVAVRLHIEPKTAVLCRTLSELGATVVLTGNEGTTRDAVADALRQDGLAVYGRRADSAAQQRENIAALLRHEPDLILDNGAEVLAAAFERPAANLRGATEETTTGRRRLADAPVRRPVLVINDSPLKQLAENEHGVGPTVIEAIMRATNQGVAGREAVVHGFGSVGRGIARTLAGLRARVHVTEPDPILALRAALEGFSVADPQRIPAGAALHITATGCPHVLDARALARVPDGAVLANAGHRLDEIDLDHLRRAGTRETTPAPGLRTYHLDDGRKISVVAEGNMANLAAGGGNPVEAMDLGLALQLASLAHLARHGAELAPELHPVPDEINREIAELQTRLLCPLRSPCA